MALPTDQAGHDIRLRVTRARNEFAAFVIEYNGLYIDESAPCRSGHNCDGVGRVSVDDTLDDVFDCEYCRLIDGFE